jgi:hypothetical protein
VLAWQLKLGVIAYVVVVKKAASVSCLRVQRFTSSAILSSIPKKLSILE